MKLALAQLNPTIGDLAGNAQKILAQAQRAQQAGADLLLTPELALCGYPPRDLLLDPAFIQALERQLQGLAQACPTGLGLLVGTVTANPEAQTQGGKGLWNSAVLLGEGQVQCRFHKRLLPTYDVFDEDRYFAPGETQGYFLWAGLKIGVTICEDLWNDEAFWGQRRYAHNPLADLAQAGVDLVLNLSASPYSLAKQRLRQALVQHSAQRFQLPIVYANQVGGNDDLIFDGASFVVNCQGHLLCRAQAFAEDLIYLDFETTQGDFLAGPCQPYPEAAAELFAALVLGVKDYLHKCGFSRAVLGLSGGIDSALVAAIAVAALGAENVLGILMPSPYSSDHSLSDALALAQNLGITTHTIPIEPAMATYDQMLAPLFQGMPFGLAEENIQARIRGNVLMAIANKFGHLLLTTGNKSEMAVGYCTLYGDMNGGLAVIADLPKTQVFKLCHWLNRDREVIPANILSKPPSAELKPGQVDQDSLPPYEILDQILEHFIHHHQSRQAIIQAGFEPETVHRVAQLIRRAEFKRRQAAPGLKVTDRAFGSGWRMPIAMKSNW
jgi:NAD+ synthetase